MEKVKALLAAGASLSGAVREALPVTLSALAVRHGIDRSALSSALNGQRGATEAMLAALITELGGTEAEWRALIRDARIAAANAEAVA